MIMTNSPSIQDVLFFPQMRPESNQGASSAASTMEGVPEPWNGLLSKLGITSKEQLKGANLNKLFNDMGGMRKKMKISDSLPGLDVIRSWSE
jgi:lysyl-tRNA synthetase class 2